ncbi:MAG: hypothetical protein LBL21_04740 [Rickettsiales bacterium]|nr:hypothetical protein [Rickettsiales bacterium]
MSNDIVSLTKKAMNMHLRHIVDDVCMEIQNHLLFDYLGIVEKKIEEYGSVGGAVRVLRASIGDTIKQLLDLDDAGVNKKPKSQIIDYYTEHKLKK